MLEYVCLLYNKVSVVYLDARNKDGSIPQDSGTEKPRTHDSCSSSRMRVASNSDNLISFL
jgi:hypothetical protein